MELPLIHLWANDLELDGPVHSKHQHPVETKMRLTLRTLLAYLDDVLEPAQTKLIGQKIQESAVAGKLVSLIRLVVRQRRLKAPSVSGPNVGIDPNIVAQYLDNTLAPEQVVEVEKVLLTSDELLAEVAACHQVLALVMGKPTEISVASRERLYALGPVSQTEQLRVEEPAGTVPSEAAVVGAAARESERIAESVSQKPVPAEVPEYLRRSSWVQKVFPAAVVVLLCVVCVGLFLSDPTLRGIGKPNQDQSKNDLEAAKTATANGDAGKTPDNSKPDDTTGPAQNPTQLVSIAATTPLESPNLPSPMPQVDQSKLPDVPAAPLPATEANNKGPAETVAPTNRNPAPAVAVAPLNSIPTENVPKPILAAATVQYTSNDGVVIRSDETQRHWYMIPRKSSIALGEHLAVLEPFEAAMEIDQGAIFATVMGDTSFRLLPPDRMTSWGMDIRRGRILLRSGRKDALKASPIAVVVGNDFWRLEFQTTDTTCALEIIPREPVHFEKPFGPNWYLGTLSVLSGSVKLTEADGRSVQVGSETVLEIAPQDPARATLPSPVSSIAPPDWTDAVKRKQHPVRLNSMAFEKNFDLDQPVEMTLLSLLDHRQAKVVELAVHGLAVTETIEGLTQALSQCTYEEGRFSARDGIRQWLGRDVSRGKILKDILEKRYPATEATAVYILLWGFNSEDATNRPRSLEFLTWLRSPHLEIRELAYYWVLHLTGRKWEFRAAESAPRRETAIRKIEAHIATAGALVKPPEKEPVTK